MKKVFWVGSVCVLSAVFFSACDIIEERNGYTELYSPSIGANNHKVLLEEYTGMRCVNCPAAAEEAKLLQQTFGESLIVVAIHAGGFAVPSGSFQPDLRTEAGNIYFSHFGFAGTPVGMVNRKKHAGFIALNPSNWADAVKDAMLTSSEIQVNGKAAFIQEGESICQCTIHVSGLPAIEGSKLMLWLVEDNIITPQVVPGGVEQKYVQRHVLRETLNGTWGEVITADENQEWSRMSIYKLRSDVNIGKCAIIALVTLPSSNEIAAVVQIPISIKY